MGCEVGSQHGPAQPVIVSCTLQLHRFRTKAKANGRVIALSSKFLRACLKSPESDTPKGRQHSPAEHRPRTGHSTKDFNSLVNVRLLLASIALRAVARLVSCSSSGFNLRTVPTRFEVTL